LCDLVWSVGCVSQCN